MSKSYRYNPDEGGYENRRSWVRPDEEAGFDAEEEVIHSSPQRKKKRKAKHSSPEAQYAPMSPEWAIELMKERVGAVLDLLEKRRIIAPHERDDYMQEMNIRIWQALPHYDENRTDEGGNPVAIETFLSTVINNTEKNIKMITARRRKNVPVVPFLELGGGDECEDEDGKDCEGNPFKDHRRYMEALWLKMDMESLSEMMGREERLTLFLRLAEFTYPQIAEEVSARLGRTVDRFHVMNVTMPEIRRKARSCGFEPHSAQNREEENS